MRYILDDPEITGPGNYNYRLIEREEMADWIKQKPWFIRVRNKRVAKHLESILREEVSLQPAPRWVMDPGDEALIIRTAPAEPDPGRLEREQGVPVIIEEQWEYGILKRVK
jgi:hypothetical protein